MAVTIKDIAKAANVSATTVSRVVNNKNFGISESKREEIQQLIKKMGYRPNAMARALVTKTTNEIGIVMPNIIDPFFAEIAKGIQDSAEEEDYISTIVNSHDDRKKEFKAIELLVQRRVDGIILYASGKLNTTQWKKIKTLIGKTPVVIIGHAVEGLSVPMVYLDYQKGMKKITDYLLNHGHEEIVYMAGMFVQPEKNQGLCGYMESLEGHNISYKEKLVCNGDFTLEGAKDAIQALLSTNEKPTAVICENDFMSAGVLEALEEMAIDVPSQISVVGFDNTFFSRFSSPKLTTYDYPKIDMGNKAFEILQDSINENEAKHSRVELNGQIIERNSVMRL